MKRRALFKWLCPPFAILAVALLPPNAGAEPLAPSAPDVASPPTTQPIRPRIRVLLVPHRQLDRSATTAWIADAVRESVRGNLVRARNLEVDEVPASLVPIASDAAALTTAKRIDSRYVLSGSYQVIDNKVRILSTLTDVSTGQIIASYSQTGDISVLFDLEDDLAQEVRASLAKVVAATDRTQTTASTEVAPVNLADASAMNSGPLRLQLPVARLENPYLHPYEDQHATMSRQNYFYNSGPSSLTYSNYGCFGPTYGRYNWSYHGSAYPYFSAPGGAASKYGAATP